MNRILLLCMLVLAVPAPSLAEAPLDSKATQAVNVQLFSVSRLPANIGEAPAIITTYSADYVRRFGFRTVGELLETTPGFDQRLASWYETPATRGISDSALLMIDGTPINSHLTNSFPAGYGLDLGNYKTVEVVSGPGGVLWGSHSLLGVVNLISLDGADVNGVIGRTELGSFGHQRYVVRGGSRWRDLDVYLSANYLRRRDASITLASPTLQTTTYGNGFGFADDSASHTTSNKTDYSLEVLGKIQYQDFRLFARIPYSKNYFQVSEQGGLLAPNDDGFRRSDDWLTYLSYSRAFPSVGATVLAKTYYYRNLLVFDNRLWSPNPLYPNGFGVFINQGEAYRWGGLAETSWTFKFKRFISTKALVGLESYTEAVSGAKVSVSDANGFYSPFSPLMPDANTFVLSPYATDELRIIDRVVLFGGLRFNYADSYKSRLLLSGNALVRLFKATYAKFGITQGMRPPTMAERFGGPPYAAPLGDYLQQNSAYPMAPATSSSWQLELNTKANDVGPLQSLFSRVDFAATNVRDIRQLMSPPHDPGIQYYVPRIDRNIISIEHRTDLTLAKDLIFWASYAYNYVTVPSSGQVTIIAPQQGPQHVVSLGGHFRPWRYVSLIARGTTTIGGKRSVLVPAASSPQGGVLETSDIPTAVLLTAGVSVSEIFRDLTLSLFAYNLLDRNYAYYPFTNVPQNNFNPTPSDGQAFTQPQPGLNFFFTAQMSLF